MFWNSKTKLLKQRKDLITKMILDCEIDIEVEWLLMNRAEKEIGKLKEELNKNLQIIEEEKKKTPMDMDKVETLAKENVDLGQTDLKDKNDKPIYGGKMAKINEILSFHHNEVNKKVGEREYTKLRLKAVNRMLETNYMKHFPEILKTDEEITFKK